MSRLAELREKTTALRAAVQKEKAERIKQTVQEVVNSDAFELALLDMVKDTVEVLPETAKKIADQITDGLCGSMLNPTNDFLDVCHARGMTETRIKRTVSTLNKVFELTASEDYEEQLQAVALYMNSNQSLYDDIAAFR